MARRAPPPSRATTLRSTWLAEARSVPPVSADELFREGKLEEAIELLGVGLRSNPADAQRRTFLFELLCFAGAHERADKQLDVLAGANPQAGMGALLYRAALPAERTRQELFLTGAFPQGGPGPIRMRGALNGRPFHELVIAVQRAARPMAVREGLLQPIPGLNPAGTNLRYDPIYDKIKEARREEEDVEQGEWKRARKVADWPLVIKLASDALATKSKDLQIAAWLTEALLKQEALGGLRAGLGLLQGLLEKFWRSPRPARNPPKIGRAHV